METMIFCMCSMFQVGSPQICRPRATSKRTVHGKYRAQVALGFVFISQ